MDKWVYIQENDDYAYSDIKKMGKAFFFPLIRKAINQNKELILDDNWPELFRAYKKLCPGLCIEVLANFLTLCNIEDIYIDFKPNETITRSLRCWRKIEG